MMAGRFGLLHLRPKHFLRAAPYRGIRTPPCIVGFHLLGSVPEPFTVWRGIQCLPAGTTLAVDAAGPGIPQRYYDIASHWEHGRIAGLGSDARARITDAVRDFRSTSPHCGRAGRRLPCPPASISGALLGTMSGLGVRDITAVTLGFSGVRGTTARRSALGGQGRRPGMARVTSCERSIGRSSSAISGLAGRDGYLPTGRRNQHLVRGQCRARGRMKVALSGLGADECFGGYPSFKDVPRSVHWLRPVTWLPGLGPLVRRVLSRAIAAGVPLPQGAGAAAVWGHLAGRLPAPAQRLMPWELDEVLDPPALVEEGMRSTGAAQPYRSLGKIRA